MAEKTIEIAKHPRVGVRMRWTKTLKSLDVGGDCLCVPAQYWSNVSGAATQLKKHGFDFISRQVGDNILYGRIK